MESTTILLFLMGLGIIFIIYEQINQKAVQVKQNEVLTKIATQQESNNISILKTQKDICQVLNNSTKALERIANSQKFYNANEARDKKNYKKPEKFEALVL